MVEINIFQPTVPLDQCNLNSTSLTILSLALTEKSFSIINSVVFVMHPNINVFN